jgi:hypothetical protein
VLLLLLLLLFIVVSLIKSVECKPGGIIEKEGWAINTNVHKFLSYRSSEEGRLIR